MTIDRSSLGWIGYTIMAARIGLTAGQMEENWSLNVDHWTAVSEVIAREAIKRHLAAQNQADTSAAKPAYGNFFEITRIMSGG